MITVFLRSLTEHWDGRLIAVIVSGYDGDGTDALCGIKDVGGRTIAQKLETAGQPDMPESAIASGCIDFILSPEVIAKEIMRIAQRSGRVGSGAMYRACRRSPPSRYSDVKRRTQFPARTISHRGVFEFPIRYIRQPAVNFLDYRPLVATTFKAG